LHFVVRYLKVGWISSLSVVNIINTSWDCLNSLSEILLIVAMIWYPGTNMVARAASHVPVPLAANSRLQATGSKRQ
jgi:hypothetical protein